MKKILLIIFIIIFCITIATKQFNKETNDNFVRFTSWGSQSEVLILKELLTKFENEYKIKVDFVHIPQNYFQKIHLLFASNQAPDVLFINNHYLKMYTNANLLEDLTPYIKNKNEFYNIALDCLSDNNKIYAIPRDISNLVLYVNLDILKKANIQYKEKINTLKELMDVSKKLTSKDNYGINFEEDSLFWVYYLAANGGGILSDNAQEIKINKKQSIEAINFYADLVNKYNIAPTKAQIGSMTTAQMFINGKLGLYLGGRWMVPKFRETINFNWDIIEFPSTNENKVYIDTSGWAISKASKNKENAIKLILFLSSKDAINELSKSGLIIPARKEVAQKYLKNNKKTKPYHSEIFINMLDRAKPTPTNKNYGKINDILKERIQNIFSGATSTNEALNKKTIEKIEGLL